jgi:hypothetical protein
MRKEEFIQDYCNKGERLNSTPLRQKAGIFSNAEEKKHWRTWKIFHCDQTICVC